MCVCRHGSILAAKRPKTVTKRVVGGRLDNESTPNSSTSLFAQPDANVLGLQGFIDHPHLLSQQRVQVGLVACGLGELGQHLLGVVLLGGSP